MKRDIEKWTVQKLKSHQLDIGFPDFQREPTVWDLDKKRSLVDSIFRGFDISPIYLYKRGEDSYDCIDGRQRINAIYSFLGINSKEKEKHNGFTTQKRNEIYTDKSGAVNDLLNRIEGKNYEQLKDDKGTFDKYEINIVIIDTKLDDVLELNLLFSRLQLGETLNSGEKLNAMTGDMRDFVFKARPAGIQDHPFFQKISTPYRRFAGEQIAAQIALNYFSRHGEKKDFTRSRYIDLQVFFKDKTHFKPEDLALTTTMKTVMDKLAKVFEAELAIIENRAIAVSTFLFADELISVDKEDDLSDFKEFMKEFVATLKWQVKAHHNFQEAKEYQEILSGFQNYITQAAGESYALRNRHNFIKKYFTYFLNQKEIIGDKEYNSNKDHKKSAKQERSKIAFKQLKLVDSDI